MRKDYFIYLECDLTNDRIEKLESQNSTITKVTKNFLRYTDYFDYVHSHMVCPDDQKRFAELFQRSKLIENYSILRRDLNQGSTSLPIFHNALLAT